MEDIRNDPEHKNYISLYRGFAYVGEKLEAYTLGRLDTIYQRIYKKEAGKPLCVNQCSQTFKDQISKWCATCKGWQSLLLKTHQNPNHVKLGQMHSWLWPESSRNIAEIYLPLWWQNQHVDIRDITTACFIWEKCKDIPLRNSVIKRVRDCRNDFFAHNSSLKVTMLNKAKTFDALKDLLHEQDLQGYIDTKECIRHLTEIEQGYKLELWEKAVLEHDISLAQLKDGQHEILRLLQDSMNKQDSFIATAGKRIPINTFASIVFKVGRTVLKINPIYIFLLNILFLSYYPFSGLFTQKETGCISEAYTFPFKQDLPLLGYLSEHRDFIGRDWLMEEIEHELITYNTTENRGLVLVAEMGYGKSAVVSKLICAKNGEKAKVINSHIVAFHVCKFNVKSTRVPERFISRLVGFLAMKSAEYGNIISTLPVESILYHRDSCSKEPDACFDQGLTNPLKLITDVPNKPWVIVVDALDECEDDENNLILDLISSRITQLPKWLKFLITSRNSVPVEKMRKLKVKYLAVNDSRNIADIKLFIDRSFRSSNQEFIDNMTRNNDGSFLYVVQVLTWFNSVKNVEDQSLPYFRNTLADIYEINFDRQFKNQTFYKIPKMILEIICSTTNPLGKKDIYSVLTANNKLEYLEFEKTFKSLQFFINVDKGVSLFHQTIYYWLTSDDNKIYGISLNEGHSLISNYLFTKFDYSDTNNIVNLAIHVANSADTALIKTFTSLKMIDKNISKRSHLHKLIWKTSSVKALELLTYHIADVNGLNEGNVTPAFIAAAKGHVDQFKLLHKKGANIDFKVEANFVVVVSADPFDIANKLELMKQVYYSGYSCLHIAAQHGHTDIVKYILKHKKSLLYYKNTPGLHAGLTACEHGHIDVIREIYKFDPDIFGYNCMYYAASRNHKIVLEWLLQKAIKFRCITESRSNDAFNVIFRINVTNINNVSKAFFPNLTSENEVGFLVNPVDKFWIYFRQDPLIAAIIHGSLDAAKYLIEKFPDSLKCSDTFGYTAALLSVKFNRTELFPLLAERLVSDKCRAMTDFQALQDFNAQYCPNGATYLHIAAMSSHIDVLVYAYKNKFHIPWNEPDSLGNLPIHYAVENKNGVFIHIFKQFSDISFSDARALNGSTPYHIAALSREPFNFYPLTDSLKQTFSDLKDNENRSVTHYLALTESSSFESENHILTFMYFHIFPFLIETCKHDLMAIDSSGRNVLHYVLRYGNAHMTKSLRSNFKSKLSSLVTQKDTSGSNPVHYALSNNLRVSKQITVHNSSCPFLYVFSAHCDQVLPNVMSSWELSIVYLIQAMPDSKLLQAILESDLNILFHKSAYITLAYFVYFKNLKTSSIRRHLMDTSYNPINSVKYISLLAIAKFKPDIFLACNKTLHASPLHFLMLHDEEIHALFQIKYMDVKFFLKFVFDNPLNMTKFCCNDKRGYNIFHYALISGHILTARLLAREGISITNTQLGRKDIVQMALTSRIPKEKATCSTHGRNHVYKPSYTDKFLTKLINRHINTFNESDFCKSNSSDLSLVHLLAANGMINMLKLIVDTFGQDLMFCKNKDKITPLYLANIFNNKDVVNFIKQFSKLELPDPEAEEHLFLYIVHEFSYTKPPSSFLCTPLSLSMTFNMRRFTKQYYCLYSMIHQYVPIFDKDYFLFKHYAEFSVKTLSLLQNVVIINHIAYASLSSDITKCLPCTVISETFVDQSTVYNSLKSFLTSLNTQLSINSLSILECQKCTTTLKNMQYLFLKREAFLSQACSLPCINIKYCVHPIYSAVLDMFVSFYSCVHSLTIQYYVAGLKSRLESFPKSYTFLYKRLTSAGFSEGKFRTGKPISLRPSTEMFYKYKWLYELKRLQAFKQLKTLFVEHPHILLSDRIQQELYENARTKINLQPFVLTSPFHDLE